MKSLAYSAFKAYNNLKHNLLRCFKPEQFSDIKRVYLKRLGGSY